MLSLLPLPLLTRLSNPAITPIASCLFRRSFATSHPSPAPARNRIYNSFRNPFDLETALILSASSNVPLLTFWKTSFCPSCKVVGPLIRELVEEGAGEMEGSVGYAEVELDAPDVMGAEVGGLGGRYMINSTPTLLAFSRSEPQQLTKLTNVAEMKDREFMRMWIEHEAARGGAGGAGGGGGLFGGLFGLGKR